MQVRTFEWEYDTPLASSRALVNVATALDPLAAISTVAPRLVSIFFWMGSSTMVSSTSNKCIPSSGLSPRTMGGPWVTWADMAMIVISDFAAQFIDGYPHQMRMLMLKHGGLESEWQYYAWIQISMDIHPVG